MKDAAVLEFEPNDLFDSTTLKNMQIGMTICRKFLQELGQVLEVKQKGRQLHFSFDLEVQSEELLPRERKSEVHLRDVSVHVVDDNNVNILIITRMLKFLEVRYSTSSDGREVVNKVASNDRRFDMIDDYQMV